MKKIAPNAAGVLIRDLWEKLCDVDEKLDFAKLADKEEEVRDKLERAQVLLDDLVCLLNPKGII